MGSAVQGTAMPSSQASCWVDMDCLGQCECLQGVAEGYAGSQVVVTQAFGVSQQSSSALQNLQESQMVQRANPCAWPAESTTPPAAAQSERAIVDAKRKSPPVVVPSEGDPRENH